MVTTFVIKLHICRYCSKIEMGSQQGSRLILCHLLCNLQLVGSCVATTTTQKVLSQIIVVPIYYVAMYVVICCMSLQLSV